MCDKDCTICKKGIENLPCKGRDKKGKVMNTVYLCRSCASVNTKEELRSSGKIKGLSLESSNQLKICKNCKGRIFTEMKEKQDVK